MSINKEFYKEYRTLRNAGMPEEMIEDMIMIAVNDAIGKAEDTKKERLGSMASAMGLPVR